jgi:hypothetical protein
LSDDDGCTPSFPGRSSFDLPADNTFEATGDKKGATFQGPTFDTYPIPPGSSQDTSAHDDDDSELEMSSMEDSRNPALWRRTGIQLFVVLFLVVLTLILAFAIGPPSQKSKNSKDNHVCVENDAQDLRTAIAGLSLQGMTRLATLEEQHLMEAAVVEAYNAISGGCQDVYERFMYNASLINQTLIPELEGWNESGLVAEFRMTVSCWECPEDEAFASEFPTSFDDDLFFEGSSTRYLPSYSSKKSSNSRRVRGESRRNLHPTLDLPHHRRSLQDDDQSTINAADVVLKVDENLDDASRLREIESTYSGLVEASIRVSTKGQAHHMKKSKKEGKSCGGAKKGKGHSCEPSAMPSDQPSSKPSSPPSTSAQPSSQPSSIPSKQPSNQPSISSQPSSMPSKQPSNEPSSIPSSKPSLSSQPSSVPSSKPSLSSQPSSLPSSKPSLSSQPSSVPSKQPSLSSQPSSRPTS